MYLQRESITYLYKFILNRNFSFQRALAVLPGPPRSCSLVDALSLVELSLSCISMLPALPCTVPDCNFSTPSNLSSDVAIQLLAMHMQDVHSTSILHPSFHTLALHRMQQQEGEQIRTFAARVQGTAQNCGLIKKCPKVDCNQDVPFFDETAYHVVMAGLHDQDLHKNVKAEAMLGTVTDLASLISYVSAKESEEAKMSVHEVEEPKVTGDCEKSDYARNKSVRCFCCGNPKHGENNKDRTVLCKAYGKICTRCNKPNHFATQCKSSRPRASIAPSITPAAPTGPMNAFLSVGCFIISHFWIYKFCISNSFTTSYF